MSTSDGPGAESPGVEALRADLEQILAPEADIDFVYLFGSRVKGSTRRDSDVDVAIHLKGDTSPSRRFDRRLELEAGLERALGHPVDVVVLNDAPLELCFNVLAHGVLVSARDDRVRRHFYVDTGRRYYDMAPARELFRRRQQERIREGTFGGPAAVDGEG